jgi:glucokinase
MTTILVVDIGGTNVKVGFTVDGNSRTTTSGCFRLMKYATEIRFPALRDTQHEFK